MVLLYLKKIFFQAIDDYPHDFELCLIVQVSAIVIFIASLTSVLVLAIDRFFAIFCPIPYRRQSKNRATFCVAVSWLFPVIMALPVIFDKNSRKRFEGRCILTRIVNYDVMLLHSYTAVLAFLIMIAIYSLIFYKIYNQVNYFHSRSRNLALGFAAFRKASRFHSRQCLGGPPGRF